MASNQAGNNQSLYGFPQPLSKVFPSPFLSQRAPAVTDIDFPIGQVWIDEVGEDAYILVSIIGGSAAWNVIAVTPGNVDTLTGDSGGAITPLAGDIGILGTTDQITTTGSGVGHTITMSLPVAITAPGSLTTTTTLVGGTGITATTGNIVATLGNITASAGNIASTLGSVSAGTTVTAGTGVTATTGDITATAGDLIATVGDITASAGNIEATLGSLSAGTTVTAGTGVTATTGNITADAGNIAATLGSVTAGTLVTGGTGVTATTGNITATNGDLVLGAAGNKLKIHASTAASDSIGTATLTNGSVTVATTAIKTGSLVFLSYNSLTSALACSLSYGTIVDSTSFVITSQDGTDSTSTVNYLIIN